MSNEWLEETLDVPAQAPTPEMSGDVILEVKKAEAVPTQGEDGTVVKLEFRCGSKPWSGRKVFEQLYVHTTDKQSEGKVKGARIGSSKFNAIRSACGYYNLEELKKQNDGSLEKAEKAIQLGLGVAIKDVDGNKCADFSLDMIVGKFFLGTVKTEEDKNDPEKRWPRLKKAQMIDVEQYNDLLSACDFSRTDDGGEQPPF